MTQLRRIARSISNKRQLSAHVTRITVTGGYGDHLARFFAVNSPLIVTYSIN